ncbi:nucleoside hydrolase [Goodfellowiella coeruleoviolacea]|uniref:Purine nucleosidase n=1 Tax=Goodfellowiella coeruleoviolacea TaxID=334858 RepID=A0AAE3GHU8_9PSEU|nr:nucleoside hydrolase [Goodfellowiella coeruleoviolacea]MCP2167913.1 purine nucleosidase [Goodfellowiella coeruleoviolacea]
MSRWLRVLAVVALVVCGAVGVGVGAPALAEDTGGAPGADQPVPVIPVPVIYDSDVDVDDAMTIAYLCQEHEQRRIDLRAVTVTNNGFGLPGRALTHVRGLLARCGLPDVPVAEGADEVVHAAPAETREAVEAVLTGALADAAVPSRPGAVNAAQLIRHVLATAPRAVTVLATGSMSNLAAALRAGGDRVAERIGRLHVMGGAIGVPGNLYGSALPGFDNSQEFNMWLDPAAARAVFQAVPPGVLRLVPLDATNHVPMTQSYVDELGADQRTPGGRLVHALLTQPAMVEMIREGGMYWWDALTAVTALRHEDAGQLVRFHDLRLDVVLDGVQSGRTRVTPDGRWARVALTADRGLFERIFRDALNGR